VVEPGKGTKMAGNPKEEDKIEFDVEEEVSSDKTPVKEPEIEVEDDTPEVDRDRPPLPKHVIDEVEADELEAYTDKVKTRLKQMKRIYHDERREKERATREQHEALNLAQRLLAENRQLKSTLHQGEQTLVHSFKTTAEMEMAAAKKEFKEAYEAGDADKVADAQERLSSAGYKLEQVKAYRPAVQQQETEVELPQDSVQKPRLDPKTEAWQERNSWWGVDPEMTSTALGYHQALEQQYGKQFVGTDDYWRSVDVNMRRRFPEKFEDAEKTTNGAGKTVARTESKSATVVAPASRSTGSKRLVLKQSQLNIAKRLGLTPEQYAREFAKLEN
tara:strand:- start:4010 stop:5002 length:993 start_codon:yes stop_codon:yes gene_type:complete